MNQSFEYAPISQYKEELKYIWSWEELERKMFKSHGFGEIREFSTEREEEIFEDPKNLEKLVKFGWKKPNNTIDREIEYHYDKWGYRNREEINSPDAIAVGCSTTFGIGMDDERIWPTLVSKEIGMSIRNFGIPGGSFESIHRVLTVWLEELKPKYVFLAYPASIARRSFISPINHIKEVSPRWEYYEHMWNDREIWISNTRAQQAIKWVCHENNVKLIETHLSQGGNEIWKYSNENDIQIIKEDFGSGRDLMHAGSQEHYIYSHHILSQI